jgi:predicted acyltransferase
LQLSPEFRFVLALLAVWRLTHLLAAEDGPWNLIAQLRRIAGSSVLGKLMDCFYCLSIWISIPFCLYPAEGLLNRIVTWLALSGAASLLHKLTEKQTNQPEEFDPFGETK